MISKIQRLRLLCCLLIVAENLFGQGFDQMDQVRDSKGEIEFVRVSSGHPKKLISDGHQFLKSIHKASGGTEFNLIKRKTDGNSQLHQVYQQYFRGIPVEEGYFVVHGKGDSIEKANGIFIRLPNISIAASISEVEALKLALTYVDAERYAWDDQNSEAFLKNRRGENATYFPKGELVICKNELGQSRSFELAWKFSITGLQPYSSQLVYVGANSGTILKSVSLICNALGTAATRYSGTRSISTEYDNIASSYRLRESRNGVQLNTFNLYGTTNASYAVDFTDNDNIWSSAEFNNVARDNAALDCHWGTEIVMDYWLNGNYISRHGLDDNHFSLNSYVHYGISTNNAYWDPNLRIVMYGDGANLSPLVSLDVVGHETSHGFNYFEGGPNQNGEPGALNEGLSDIWASVIENWGAPEKNRWLLGEDLSGGPLRPISNPNSMNWFLYDQNQNLVASGPYPDTYGGNGFYNGPYDYGGVHENLTVLTYWFYLTTVGGSGTNDWGNCYIVTGIGTSDAARIVYRAQTAPYLFPSANFNSARTAMIQASIDLFGPNSQQTVSVTNAWWAVGIGSAYQNTSADIVGNEVCTTGTSIHIDNTVGNFTWSATPSSLFVTSSGSGSSAFLQAKSSKSQGAATITFTPVGGCNGTANPISKQIWVGKPLNNINGQTTVYPGQIYNYYAADLYTTNFSWTMYPYVGPCGISYGGNCWFGSVVPTQAFATVWWEDSGYVQLNSSNSCGIGIAKKLYVTVTTEGGCNPCQILSFSPNPSSGILNVRLDLKGNFEPTVIKLVDEGQTVLFSNIVYEENVKIQTTDFHDGVYYLIVSNSTGSETKRVVISKHN